MSAFKHKSKTQKHHSASFTSSSFFNNSFDDNFFHSPFDVFRNFFGDPFKNDIETFFRPSYNYFNNEFDESFIRKS